MSDEGPSTDEQRDERDSASQPATIEPQGDPAPSDAGAPQTLGLLFTAAAVGLVVLLAVIGLLAFAAMSR